tara:strand:- start:886 stop:1992 length:1107 start_codon:yes stop_codon:yes gene_type:complete
MSYKYDERIENPEPTQIEIILDFVFLLLFYSIFNVLYSPVRFMFHALLAIAALPIKIVSPLLKVVETLIHKMLIYLRKEELNLLIYPLGLLQLCLGLFLFTPIFWLNNTLSYLIEKLQLPVLNKFDAYVDRKIYNCEKVFDINDRRPTNQSKFINAMGLNTIVSYPLEVIRFVLGLVFEFLDMLMFNCFTTPLVLIIASTSFFLTLPFLLFGKDVYGVINTILLTLVFYPYSKLVNLLLGDDPRAKGYNSNIKRQSSLAEKILYVVQLLAIRLFDFALCLIVSPFILVYELIYNLINFVQAEPETSYYAFNLKQGYYGSGNTYVPSTPSNDILPKNRNFTPLSGEEDDVDLDITKINLNEWLNTINYD